MTEFKVDDRVRVVKDEHTGLNGYEGRVVDVHTSAGEVEVLLLFDGIGYREFTPDELELVERPGSTKEALDELVRDAEDLGLYDITPRRRALLEAADIVDNERNREYGEPVDNLGRTAALVQVLFPERQWSAADIARFMMLVKLARSVHEYKHDTAVDTLGWGAIWVELEES